MLPASFTPSFLRSLELFKLRNRRAVLGSRQGAHLSTRRGQGIEFSDFRKYEAGDSPRHIDWGLYARSDRLYVKRFREEQNLSLLLILDASASMSGTLESREGSSDSATKWNRACEIALSIAYIALMSQDTVSVAILGKQWLPNLRGGAAIHRLSHALHSTVPAGKIASFGNEISAAVRRLRFPGVCLIISDLLFPVADLTAAIRTIRGKNFEGGVVQVLAPHDINPFSLNTEAIAIDSETEEEIQIGWDESQNRAYQELLNQHSTQVRATCYRNAIGFSQHQTDAPLREYILETLPSIGLLQ